MSEDEDEYKVKITEDLNINYDDLMKTVDFSHVFTLRDVIRAVSTSSHIPENIMGELIHCSYFKEFWYELNSDEAEIHEKSDHLSEVEHLSLAWCGSKSCFDGEDESSNSWTFDGLGRAGEIPDDLKEHCDPEDVQKLIDTGWRQGYAIEFTPVYELEDLEIKINDTMFIEDYKDENYSGIDDNKINFKPSISLIELIHAVFWELSFCGPPEIRNERKEEIAERIEEFDKAVEDGTLEEKSSPWEDVKKELKERHQNNKEDDN